MLCLSFLRAWDKTLRQLGFIAETMGQECSLIDADRDTADRFCLTKRMLSDNHYEFFINTMRGWKKLKQRKLTVTHVEDECACG